MSEERDKRDRREMEDEVAASLDMQAMTERAKRAEARVKELEPALEFVSELNRLDGDEAEGVKEILSKPKFWATEYAHAMGQLASVMDVDERRVKAEAENAALRASNEGMRQQQYELEDRVDALRAERDRPREGVRAMIAGLGAVVCPECDHVFMVTVPEWLRALASGEESR